MKLSLLFVFTLSVLLATPGSSQDKSYARKMIDTLSSSAFKGRGYTDNSDRKAAQFIAQEFKKAGLKKLSDSYYQNFLLNVNTFPSNLDLSVNGTVLTAGEDFIPDPCSPTIEGSFPITKEPEPFPHFLLFDAKASEPIGNDYTAGLLRREEKKLTWHISDGQCATPKITIMDSGARQMDSIKLDIEAELKLDYTSQNVIGLRTGRKKKEYIVITAHYDHLGQLGEKMYIPGANDNASGTALLMDLARGLPKTEASLLFVAFSGEELGLIGSSYFVRNAPIPLEQIKMVINLDLVGTGSEGATVVNGSVYQGFFQKMDSINTSNNLLVDLKARGEACNSDHCPFHALGIPSFFIYTRGGIKAYHDIYDKAETLPLTAYEELYKLIELFIDEI